MVKMPAAPTLQELATLVRYFILKMSTLAGSGHPTSSLSATDLMTALFAEVYQYDFRNPKNPYNDRLIFSKGHASPLYYALFAAAGAIKPTELDSYRKFTSVLEGHPTPRFPYTEASTGSLGQGLSIGVGFALASKYLDHVPSRTFVLLGDGEMAEGSVWEAMEIANKYQLANLIGILDVNRLGQSDETMLGYDLETYKKRIESFGWATSIIEGHDFDQIRRAYATIGTLQKPFMVIAKTVKGKGVGAIEGKNGWHGKALAPEDFEKAVKGLGDIDFKLKISVQNPNTYYSSSKSASKRTRREVYPESFDYAQDKHSRGVLDSSVTRSSSTSYKIGDSIATRKAYGEALTKMGKLYLSVIALDAEVKNSTFSEIFKAAFPERFFEMYIAEQNMVGAAVGLARRGYIPFVSTFAAFLTRAFDQIRMGAISGANIKFCGSHAGVSIGEDGPSQMGLEDLAMFRAVNGCRVIYPSDAVSTERLVEEMIRTDGMVYMRTTRPNTPVIYGPDEFFPFGGSKVHKMKTSPKSPPSQGGARGGPKLRAVIIGAGVTLHEALKAQKMLAEEGIKTVVVDCYSIKPIDEKTIRTLAKKTSLIVTVEDHWFDGGLGDAVLNVFVDSPTSKRSKVSEEKPRIIKLAVSQMPRSGKPAELLAWAGIDAATIMAVVKKNS